MGRQFTRSSGRFPQEITRRSTGEKEIKRQSMEEHEYGKAHALTS
jgi:hypothetical protein